MPDSALMTAIFASGLAAGSVTLSATLFLYLRGLLHSLHHKKSLWVLHVLVMILSIFLAVQLQIHGPDLGLGHTLQFWVWCCLTLVGVFTVQEWKPGPARDVLLLLCCLLGGLFVGSMMFLNLPVTPSG
ncbi:hypothetical protein [Deinococcus cellulosilyticus]|uniref:Uncharacterized protein n=1 Tax=Deinococcus cellulosilyticus (strain DSM 18568 / NBRC 106333 / KACC 11606 / 5516J-15) TaxID=1223518 RepID=A0A511MYD7_DEIC1|nr:hypothetical protein [Deinococcus cellulosilyticus]GEM45604.1 hypothetical protein DC3_12390 [Deinococcus cellulosilyticus NBRC 106333 = KACC 11606]